MEEVKVFTYNYVEELRRSVEKDGNYADYLKDSFSYKDIYPKGRTGVYLPNNYDLRIPDSSSLYDLENSISLYENLSGMNPTVASDVRLWTYLVHVQFWNYMRHRWGVKENIKNKESRIIERYHIKHLNIASLTRNGISRLWWLAHLTVDPGRNDKYELTRTLFSRADLTVSLMERTMGTNHNIRTAVLEFLRENDEIRANEDLTRSLIKYLNLVGGVKNLSFLSKEDLRKLIDNIKNIIT